MSGDGTGQTLILPVTLAALNREIPPLFFFRPAFIILNSHWAAHPPGGGPLLLFFPCLNPSPESPPRKSFDAHRLRAESRSFDHLASRASASQSLLLVFRQGFRLQTTTPPSG